MIHWALRLWISLSIDGLLPIPRWLDRWIQSDHALRSYRDNIFRLVEQLTEEGSLPVHIPRRLETRNRQRSEPFLKHGWNWMPLALAASLVVLIGTVGIWWNRPANPSVTAEVNRPEEVEIRQYFASQMLANTQQWNERLVEGIQSSSKVWPERVERFPVLIVAEWRDSVREISIKPWEVLSEGMESEQRKVRSDLRNGLAFVSLEVPRSFGKLIGWNGLQ